MPTPKLKIAWLLLLLAFAYGGVRAETPEDDDKTPGQAAVPAMGAPVPPPVVPPASTAPKGPHAHMAWNFDWDDNIMNMKTKIVVFKKGTGEPLEISTGKWAEAEHQLGVAGTEYENYEQRPGPTGTYIQFFDQRGKNNFLDQILDAMSTEGWQGPSWKAFVEACSRKETARNVSLITARGHSPQKMWAALKELQRRGYINYVPPLNNIKPVGNPKFYAGLSDVSARKAVYEMDFLDKLQALKVRGEGDVLNSDGSGRQKMHLWGFSDDSYANFTKAVEALGKALKAKPGRWSNVKITLFYTGTKKEGVEPHALILMSNGETRPATSEELKESERLLEGYPCERPFLGVRPRR